MRTRTSLPTLPLLAALVLSAVAPGCGDQAERPRSVRIEATPEDGRLFDILALAGARAKREGLALFVQFGDDWCKPCVALKRSLDDPRMVEAFAGTLVVSIDTAVDWKGQAAGCGLDDSRIPVFHALDHRGRPTGPFITGGAWGADTVENMAPVLARFFAEAGGRRSPSR